MDLGETALHGDGIHTAVSNVRLKVRLMLAITAILEQGKIKIFSLQNGPGCAPRRDAF
jgi:hypothetical protein